MRCTSSDLIIPRCRFWIGPCAGCARPSAPQPASTLIRLIADRRVPKHYQTVKINLFGGLQGIRNFEPARQRIETDKIERFGNTKMKERQLAEARMEPPIAHRRFRIDAARLGQPIDGLLLAADLVDQLERNPLPA